jgi:hypothetical protein
MCGSTMFCKAHGGGKRCQYPEGCHKSAQRPTIFASLMAGASDVNIAFSPDGMTIVSGSNVIKTRPSVCGMQRQASQN